MKLESFDPEVCEPHAVVREEDVQLVLSAVTDLHTTGESLKELEQAALGATNHAPGSVVVQGGRPLRLLAIIHDVDREPSWREDWILAAMQAVFRESHWRGLTRIAMPLPGTVHGRLAPQHAAELLATVLEQAGVVWPETLWLENVDADVPEWLRRRLA